MKSFRNHLIGVSMPRFTFKAMIHFWLEMGNYGSNISVTPTSLNVVRCQEPDSLTNYTLNDIIL